VDFGILEAICCISSNGTGSIPVLLESGGARLLADKTKQAAPTTKQRVDQMNSDSANYFSSWKADNDKISNPQMQLHAPEPKPLGGTRGRFFRPSTELGR
jgi:hypothetical protein